MLVSWEEDDYLDPHSIKGIIAEMMACLGPRVADGVVVTLGS
jgi:arginyl-tRNA---protein transferase